MKTSAMECPTCGKTMSKEHGKDAWWCVRCKRNHATNIAIPRTKTSTSKHNAPNKTELEYRNLYLRGVDSVYEGVSFVLANGHRYTPDWAIRQDGKLIGCVEVKARGKQGFRHASYQRARVMFDQARIEWSGITWVWTEKQRGEWKHE